MKPPQLPPEYVARGPYQNLQARYEWLAISDHNNGKWDHSKARMYLNTDAPPEVEITVHAKMPQGNYKFPTWDEALRYVETICALGEL